MRAGCQNHPEREAVGVCVSCKLLICGECTTRVDGRGLCASCIAADKRTTQLPQQGDARVALSFCVLVALTIMTWGLLEATLPGSAWW